MSMQEKIKNKILSNSDSYNYYKNELKNELEDLKIEFNNYKENNDKILESYNNLFNNIFLDFELKPKGALKLTQELCLELLDLYVNICNKYNLEYWLDYGNLLGAIRHGGFIPWDDDLDVGMMRSDSLKFNKIIEKEVEQHGLEDLIKVSFKRCNNERNTWAFTQITIRKNKALYAGLDIFPCDYIINPPKDIEKYFKEAKIEYFKNVYDGMDKMEVIDNYYDTLNCSYEKQDNFLPSIEGPVGRKAYPVKIFKTDCLFPLKKIEYEGKYYSCPNNPKEYVSNIYGNDYMNIPKVVKYHKRMKNLKKQENLEENFHENMDKIKKVNQEFNQI